MSGPGAGPRAAKGAGARPTAGRTSEAVASASTPSTSATRTRCGAATSPRSGAATTPRSTPMARRPRSRPDRALPHASIGGILAEDGPTRRGVAAYDRALALAPRDESALRGHRRGARRRLAAGPRPPRALDRLAECLDGAGRLADATDAARRALELAESRDRRTQVEGLAGRLRAASDRRRGRRAGARPGPPPARAGAANGDRRTHAGARAAGSEPEARSPSRAVVPAAEEAEPEAELAPEPEPAAGARRGRGRAEGPLVEPAGLGIALGAAAEAPCTPASAIGPRGPAGRRPRPPPGGPARRRASTPATSRSALAPADPDLHLLLAELYLDRGWRTPGGRQAPAPRPARRAGRRRGVRERLCSLVGRAPGRRAAGRGALRLSPISAGRHSSRGRSRRPSGPM